ncbi:cytokinin riboside 5'-monophosphate phosphoribohydrolase [Citrus sinensis]|nr:cytokinin riboside 5'-monophosphate phosphoribohydrolase [Citrus sinensis]
MVATSSIQLKNIRVLSGFRYGKYKEFIQAAIDLGPAIAERQLYLVYGGGDRRLSKLVSEATFIRGSQVLCIIAKALNSLGCLSNPPIGEELVISDMQERISEMLNHADAFIFLPGDLATLERKKLFICAPTANELLDLLQAYKPEPNPMTLALDCATDDDGSNPRKNCKLDLTLRL